MKKSKMFMLSLVLMTVTGFIFFAAGVSFAACPDGIISYWKLDETTGAPYIDFIGDNDGAVDTAAGLVAPTAAPAEGINGAQVFGATTGIDVLASNTFNWSGTDSFSVEVWVRTDGPASLPLGSNQVFVGRGTASSGLLWWVGVNTDGNATFFLRDGSNPSLTLTGSSLIDGNWHHVVAVRNGATDDNSLYVDGVPQGAVTNQAFAAGFASALNLQIGYVDAAFHFVGLIDEVALYDRALDPTADIGPHFTSGTDYCEGSAPTVPIFAPFPDDTTSLWPLDEGAGATDFLDIFGDNDGAVDTAAGLVAPTAAPAEGINGAQVFGATTGIDVLASNTFNWSGTDSFSVEVWVRTDGPASLPLGSNQVFVGRGTASSGLLWWVGVNTDGNATFFLRDGSNPSLTLTGSSLIDGNWHHVVAVRNGATDDNSLYVDGVPQGAVTNQAFAAGFASALNLQIGYVDAAFHFVGLIDEVALYDRVLELTADIGPHFIAGGNQENVQSLRPAPTANAGIDQTNVPELSAATLDGTASTIGYAGTTLTYLWTQTLGTAATFTDDTSATGAFIAPDVAASGETLTFQLTVTASDGQSSIDTVDVGIVDGVAPVAAAGADQSVTEGATVNLDGSASTVGAGKTAAYLWEQTVGTMVTLTGATSVTATFTAPDVAAGGEILTFKLTVTDSGGLSSEDTIEITVNDSSAAATGGGGGGGGCFIETMF